VAAIEDVTTVQSARSDASLSTERFCLDLGAVPSASIGSKKAAEHSS